MRVSRAGATLPTWRGVAKWVHAASRARFSTCAAVGSEFASLPLCGAVAKWHCLAAAVTGDGFAGVGARPGGKAMSPEDPK